MKAVAFNYINGHTGTKSKIEDEKSFMNLFYSFLAAVN